MTRVPVALRTVCRLAGFGVALLVCFDWLAASGAEKPKKPKPAKLKVSGYGIVGNFELKRILRTLELSGKKPPILGAAFVEDAAVILSARVKRDGYLKPRIVIRLELEHGGHILTTDAELLESPLPDPLLVVRAEFEIQKGVLYHYKRLGFEGLETMDQKEATSYFMETAILLHPKSARVYTPENLKKGLSGLTDVLERAGYEQASAEVEDLKQNDKTGEVSVRIRISQGVKSMVRSVREEYYYKDATEPQMTREVLPKKPYSKVWAQDFAQEIKTNLFHHGYPDTTVELSTTEREPKDGTNELDLRAVIKSGPLVHIGVVDFYGEKKTKETTMVRRVRVKRGELLDRIRVEEGRYRLAQMGSFDTVDLTYQPPDGQTRDVIYNVNEGKSLDLSLLFGYGSYELLRGGFELEKNNILGLGHHARLKAVQSFKASSGEFTYTIPEFVASDVDLFFNGFGLRREEIDFTRLEYGGGFGGHRYFKEYATDVSVRYSYQILNASEVPGIIAAQTITNTAVGAIITDIKHDRRDNPLYPRRGYKFFVNYELGSEYLGGEVNYHRVELSTAVHFPLGGGRYLGFGLNHGVILSMGDPAENIPFNKRFFPGGENSIRGYTEGEASPRDAFGRVIGAETFTLGTVELEQALTPKWSLVVFSDSLGFAQHVSDYPFDTGLFSIGGGIRWKTIIGPVRLEYGYNLNPRKGDPAGTLQFSLGFPF
jgi:outer membrane protein assembly complex protein YaeT